MSLSTLLVENISEAVNRELVAADLGHCLRVDYLEDADAMRVCQRLRGIVDPATEVYVLGGLAGDESLSASPERAIEIRNLKRTKLCLIVPTRFADAAASSLMNSFAVFDLDACLGFLASQLFRDLPESIRAVVGQVRSQTRGRLKPSPERWADYLGIVRDDPTAGTAGRELWRVGLIPDVGAEGLLERLPNNRRCVLALALPTRPQTSPVERLETVGLRQGGVRDELRAFLEGKRLGSTVTWLRQIAEEPQLGRLTFERWTFETSGHSDLENILVHPLVDKDGKVEPYTKLEQPSGSGTQPLAPVGHKRRVTVKWTVQPSTPTNLDRWVLELIPSRLEYSAQEVVGVDLPSAKAPAKRGQGSIPLDIDLEGMTVRAVQIRVVGIDAAGSELLGVGGSVIEGLSDEFWLSEEATAEIPQGKPRRDTVATLPLARIKAAVDLDVEALDEAPGQWIERDLHYYSITLNGRRTSRIGMSSVLRAIEERSIRQPEEWGAYEVGADIAQLVNPSELTALRPLEAASALAETFMSRRKDLFRSLEKQGPRGLIETAEWGGEMSRRARSYATAYREWLDKTGSEVDRRHALSVDTVQIHLEQTHGVESAVLILPTHPLRVLWYAAYADLLGSWESQVLKTAKAERRRMLDISLLERVTPINIPAFVLGPRQELLTFAQNLRFFWGLAVSPAVPDPGRLVADVARVLGLHEDEASLADLSPTRVATELRAYRDVHPYLDLLKLNVINPGSGAFVAEALRAFLEPGESDDKEQTEPRPALRVEVRARAHTPVPLRLTALSDLQKDVYEAQPKGSFHHLEPLFAISLTSVEESQELTADDANVSIAIDYLQPVVRAVEPKDNEDSSSFYGLLVRLLPEFTATDALSVWRHRISLPPGSTRERHPTLGSYTNDLVDYHRAYLATIALYAQGHEPNWLPGTVAELTPDERIRIDQLHHRSDWVIGLDRYFGVEFYDDPSNPNLSRVARKYLLDYAPEFLEGLGHRMLVTTSHRDEVEEILGRAMRDLGFGMVEESLGEVIGHLKTISGRLVLRILGDDAQAREAVSLGVLGAYLRATGELEDAILIPVDSHPELFGVPVRPRVEGQARARCDLILIRFARSRLVATFIEVKSRAAAATSEELLHRIVDQIEATEELFGDLFFRKQPPLRLDQALQRSRLATILRFYLKRAARHGLITSEDRLHELEAAIGRLEVGIPDFRSERRGFVVNLAGEPQKPAKLRETEIRFLTARDLATIGLTPADSPKALPDRPEMTPLVKQPNVEPGQIDLDGKGKEQSAADLSPLPAGASTVGSTSPTKMPSLPQEAARSQVETDSNLPRSGSVEVKLGLTEGTQDAVYWKPSVRGSPHLFALGIPGQGKSWSITRILTELARQEVAALVIDFHGQFADPAGPYLREAAPVVLDATAGMPFSPFEAEADRAAGASYWNNNAFSVAEIFEYVCDLGDIQRDVVYEALRDCYRNQGFETGAPQRLPNVTEVSQRLEELEQERHVRNVVPRCRPLLEFGLFKDSAEPVGAFRDLVSKGLVVDIHSLGLETLQLAAAAFLLRKIYKDMFRWGEAQQLQLVIVLDEAHRLARDITLPKIMKEGRKFGVAVVVASQGLTDYHPDVVGNAGTKVVYRTNFPMSKKVAGFLRTRKSFDLPAAIEQLDIGEAYVQTPEMAVCERVRMSPLQSPTSAPR